LKEKEMKNKVRNGVVGELSLINEKALGKRTEI
jgi:hypothetical protein